MSVIGHNVSRSLPFLGSARRSFGRLFVTVRDHRWRETPIIEWHTESLRAGNGVVLRARHQSDLVDFEWTGSLRIEGNTLGFEIEGRALRDMEVCRLGLVVLYPVRPLVGACVVAERPEGKQELLIERELHPQPIVDGVPQAMTLPFSALSINLQGAGILSCRFTGDLFALEDQRNWGDSSFNAYCTRLRAGFPRSVPNGTVIRHGVEARLERRVNSVQACTQSKYEIRLDRIAETVLRTPRLGVSVAIDMQMQDCSYLGWSHLRVDLSSSGTYPSVTRFLDQLPTNTEVQLCLKLDVDPTIDRLLVDLLCGNANCARAASRVRHRSPRRNRAFAGLWGGDKREN
jgi:hypothetical protein